ncbi:mCG14622, partial [Mus musculus]
SSLPGDRSPAGSGETTLGSLDLPASNLLGPLVSPKHGTSTCKKFTQPPSYLFKCLEKNEQELTQRETD